MKVSNSQNYNISFNGLSCRIPKCSAEYKKFVKPYLYELKKLAKNVDVTLESGAIMREYEHFKTPLKTINIKYTSKNNTSGYYNVPKMTQNMDINTNVDGSDLLDLISTTVSNIFGKIF